MNKHTAMLRGRAAGSLLCLGVMFVSLSTGLLAFSKKLEVSVPEAAVHMNPDLRSPVIATLPRGEVITLASTRKFKKEWNYVYFSSRKNGALKAGYILDRTVTKLFIPTRSVTFSRNRTTSVAEPAPKPAPTTIQWGMSSADLCRVIGDPARVGALDGFKVLNYNRQVMGRQCRIEYIFSRNRLVKTHYVFLETYPQKTQYIEEYLRLNDQFSRKYGEPAEEQKLWHDPVLKEDPHDWGQAVSLGHLSYQTRWHMDQTKIVLSLAGSRSQIQLELQYSSLDSR